MSLVGAVAIDRNEGDRIRACRESLVGRCAVVVYVDSGSVNDSVAPARSLGTEVVELNRSAPFAAVRVRNAGFDRLLGMVPEVERVQFVDGDCEVVPGWFGRASCEMAARRDLAVVRGRRRDRHPERSIYNRLADLEWDTPIGEAEACGGDAIMRVRACREAGGFKPGLIAGEGRQFCHRVRRAGRRVLGIGAEMTRHDLDMTRFDLSWRRPVHFGCASLDVTERHRGPFERRARRARAWTLGWVLVLEATAGLALASRGPIRAVACAVVACAPVVRAARIAARTRRRLPAWADTLVSCALITVGKWAEALGQLRFARCRLAGRRVILISECWLQPRAAARILFAMTGTTPCPR